MTCLELPLACGCLLNQQGQSHRSRPAAGPRGANRGGEPGRKDSFTEPTAKTRSRAGCLRHPAMPSAVELARFVGSHGLCGSALAAARMAFSNRSNGGLRHHLGGPPTATAGCCNAQDRHRRSPGGRPRAGGQAAPAGWSSAKALAPELWSNGGCALPRVCRFSMACQVRWPAGPAVVLAPSGGGGTCFEKNAPTRPGHRRRVANGPWQPAAQVSDLEIVQFHPNRLDAGRALGPTS